MSEGFNQTHILPKKVSFQFWYQEKEICFLEVHWTSQERAKDNRWGGNSISRAVLESEERSRLCIALIP